jgi:hypothetical protein
LPIRIHDLVLTLAGRLDDDALADIRQMLASAELDRSLEFLAGCLVAGRIVLTREQHAELEALFADTHLDPSVIDRVMVTDRLEAGRHRFAFGSVEGREPDRGVADAVRSVLGVLPDVRSMWCVWRLTPAGPASGPVPHLLVLVGIGPGGFAPATTYRVEDALRRAGIRASVEVLMDGVEPGEYHREAMRSARQVPFDGHGSNRPRVEPAYEAPRIAPSRVEPPRMSSPPPEPPRLEPARVSAVPPRVPEAPRMSAVPEPVRIEPAPEPPRMSALPNVEAAPEPPRAVAEPPRVVAVPDPPRAEPPAVDAPRVDSPHVEVRKDPPFGDQSRVDAPHEAPGRQDLRFGDASRVDASHDVPLRQDPRFGEPHGEVRQDSPFGDPPRVDVPRGEVHQDSPFGDPRADAPRGEPGRQDPPFGEPPRGEVRQDSPFGDSSRIDSPHVEVRKDPPFSDHVDVPPFSEPPRIAPRAESRKDRSFGDPPRTDPSRVDARGDSPFSDPPHVDAPVRQDSPFVAPPPTFAEPPTTVTPAAGGLVSPGGVVGGEPGAEPEPPRIEAVRNDPFEPPAPQFEQERLPDEPPADQPPSALREETRTDSRPSPTPRRRADKSQDEQPERPRLAPAAGADKHSQAFVDDILNTQERNLLRELQDELARREQQDPPGGSSWRIDRTGRHGKPAGAAPFEHPNQTTGPMIINGVPPHPDKRGYPPGN